MGALGPKASNPGSGCSQPLAPEALFKARCWSVGKTALCCTMLHCTQRIKVQMAFICLAQLPAEEERNDLWMPIRFNHCQWARALSRPGKLKGFTDLFSNSGKIHEGNGN